MLFDGAYLLLVSSCFRKCSLYDFVCVLTMLVINCFISYIGLINTNVTILRNYLSYSDDDAIVRCPTILIGLWLFFDYRSFYFIQIFQFPIDSLISTNIVTFCEAATSTADFKVFFLFLFYFKCDFFNEAIWIALQAVYYDWLYCKNISMTLLCRVLLMLTICSRSLHYKFYLPEGETCPRAKNCAKCA